VVSLTRHDSRGTESVAVSRETGHAFDVPRQTRAFLAAVEGRGEPAAGAQDGCAAVELCLAASRSLEAGSRPIDL
jgi:predicted dehydrogenase